MFGLENCVDFLSSVIVLWRFYCPGEVTKEREAFLQKREERASIGISFILTLLGIFVIGAAIDGLRGGPETEQDLKVVVAIAFTSIFVFGSLSIIKFRYANKLDSASLYKDGICSLIGACLAAALFINTLIIDNNPGVWWLDPVASIIGGVVALIIGLYAIVVASCVQKIPIFTIKWWFVSEGDGHSTGGDGVMKGDGGETELATSKSGDSNNGDDEEPKPLSDMV